MVEILSPSKKVKMKTTFIKIGKSQGKVLNGAIKRSSQQRRHYKTSCLLAKEKKKEVFDGRRSSGSVVDSPVALLSVLQ